MLFVCMCHQVWFGDGCYVVGSRFHDVDDDNEDDDDVSIDDVCSFVIKLKLDVSSSCAPSGNLFSNMSCGRSRIQNVPCPYSAYACVSSGCFGR